MSLRDSVPSGRLASCVLSKLLNWCSSSGGAVRTCSRWRIKGSGQADFTNRQGSRGQTCRVQRGPGGGWGSTGVVRVNPLGPRTCVAAGVGSIGPASVEETRMRPQGRARRGDGRGTSEESAPRLHGPPHRVPRARGRRGHGRPAPAAGSSRGGGGGSNRGRLAVPAQAPNRGSLSASGLLLLLKLCGVIGSVRPRPRPRGLAAKCQ